MGYWDNSPRKLKEFEFAIAEHIYLKGWGD